MRADLAFMLRPGARDLERLESQAIWPAWIEYLLPFPAPRPFAEWSATDLNAAVPTVLLHAHEMAMTGSSLVVLVYAERPEGVDPAKLHAELALRATAALRGALRAGSLLP